MNNRRLTRPAVCIAALVVACALSGGVRAETTLLQDLREGVTSVQGQIAASMHKLKKGMASMGQADGTTVTPGRSCCGSHIDIIKRDSENIFRIIDNLHAYYGKSGDTVALDELQMIGALARRLSTGALALEKAPTKMMADQAIKGMIRPFHDFDDAVARLEACCPVIPDEVEPEGKKKKKKKKKDA